MMCGSDFLVHVYPVRVLYVHVIVSMINEGIIFHLFNVQVACTYVHVIR